MKEFIRLLCVLGLWLALSPAQAKTFHVERWGLASTPCGTKPGPCRNIEDAVAQAVKNDRIKVGPGEYLTNISITTEGLKLESTHGAHATILRANVSSNPVVLISNRKVQIGKKGKGFTLTGASGSIGIQINSTDADSCRIQGNYVYDNGNGIVATGDKVRLVDNQVVDNLGFGIYVSGTSNAMVLGNRSESNGVHGFYFQAAEKSVIFKNLAIRNAQYGMLIEPLSYNGRIKNNVIKFNGWSGPYAGLVVVNSEGTVIDGNIVSANTNHGLVAGSINHPQLGHSIVGEMTLRNNLVVGTAEYSSGDGHGFVLRDTGFPSADDFKFEGNSAISNDASGVVIDNPVEISSFKNGNVFDQGPDCGVDNNSAWSLTLKNVWLGDPNGPDPQLDADGNDAVCGGWASNSTFAKKPRPIKVTAASKL